MTDPSTAQLHSERQIDPSGGEYDELLRRKSSRSGGGGAIGVSDLTALVSLLPAPLGDRRTNSRFVFPVASAALCAAAAFVLLSSPLAHPRRYRAERERDFELARSQSFGLFYDGVPSKAWERMRARSRSASPHDDEGLGLRSEFANRDDPARWYRDNWDADFTCPGERRVGGGGDGGRWVCDPLRAKARADRRERKEAGEGGGGGGCLVYSVGVGRGDGAGELGRTLDLAFERALLDELGGGCEVHVFDHRLSSETMDSSASIAPGITIHPWSVEGEADRGKGRRTHLTFGETVRKLGHGGRTIDVLKVDCEGCEWTQYTDWFDRSSKSSSVAAIEQILVELHGAPHTDNDFFERIRKEGYVIFHKEVDAQYGGMSVEYGFLRLRKDFFED